MFEEKKDNLNPAVPEETAAEAPKAEQAEVKAPEKPVAAKKKEMKKPEKKGKKNFQAWLHSTKFKHGSLSSLFVVGVLVLAILLNVGAVALVNRFPSLRLDLTNDQRLSLKEDFAEVIDGIDDPTEFIFFGKRDDVETYMNYILEQNVGGDAYNEGTRMLELLSKAVERNSNIQLTFVDLEANPGYAANYPDEDLGMYTIIVKSEKRYRALEISDLYQSTQTAAGGTTWKSNIESALGSAMLAVHVDKLPVVGIITGHGESTPTYLTQLLEKNNFEIRTIDLMLSQPIAEDVDVLVINGPTGDYTTNQVKILEDFLYNGEKYGKNIVMMLNPNQPTDKLTNITTFMADWGIGLQQPGQVIMESENNRYVGNGLYPMLQFEGEHMFGNETRPAIGYAAVPMRVLWEQHSGVTVKTMISTYDSAYSVSTEQIGKFEPTADDKQSFPIMTVSSKSVGGSKVTYSRLVTLASAELFNACISFSSTANPDGALTLFRYLSSTTGDENKVFLQGTDITVSDFALSNNLVNTIGMTVFMIIIPLVILAAGLVVWLRRRHL